MPETWVHGDAFVPRLYGPDHLANLDGIAWTDQQGIREGHAARFLMRDQRTNFFHAPSPVTGAHTLQAVRVEFATTFPNLIEVWVHQGRSFVTTMSRPNLDIVGDTADFATLRVLNIGQNVNRGICVSVAFTTLPPELLGGEIRFFGAGADLS
jgi:hypothetical protein